MKTFRLLVLCSALLAVAAEVQTADIDEKDNRQADFDYFYLIRQWPATFCNEHSCTHRPPRRYAFTVHGLWPQREDGTWPQFCDPGSALDENVIEDLLPELEREWPSWSSDDATFWNHEWTRHGTCAEDVIGGQHEFFKAVLLLHSKLNIQAALEPAGIVPSNSHHYATQQLKDAIENTYGVTPHITCDQQGELAEIWMCIDKDLKPIDCVDGPHPHRAATATTRHPVRYSSRAASNLMCTDVIIPELRDDLSVLSKVLDPGLQDNPDQEDSTTSTAPPLEAAEADVVAAVPSDRSPAGAVEAHVAQLMELDVSQGQQVSAEQADDMGTAEKPVVHGPSTGVAQAASTAADDSGHLTMLTCAVILVAAAVVVTAVVAMQPAQSTEASIMSRGGHQPVAAAVDTSPLLTSSHHSMDV